MRTSVLIAAIVMLASGSAFAKDSKAKADEKKQEMMKRWVEYSTPGPEHKILQGMVGQWKYTSKFWETENSKPEESKGTSTMRMIMGGRFLEHKTRGKALARGNK